MAVQASSLTSPVLGLIIFIEHSFRLFELSCQHVATAFLWICLVLLAQMLGGLGVVLVVGPLVRPLIRNSAALRRLLYWSLALYPPIILFIFAGAEPTKPASFGSAMDAKSFNVPLDTASAIYFSAITITTVGFGDIFPVSGAARSAVVVEILTGLAYGILMFSMFTTILLNRTAKADPGQDSKRPQTP
jgi:hypothetical protein